MKKQVKLFLIGLLSCISLTSCGETGDNTIQGIATFYLEGGICQNNKERVMYSYTLNDATSLTYIADPNVLQAGDINRVGYTIEGWYKTKITEGEVVTYQDKWDFNTDKMGVEGITLYANWVKDISHTYDICYKDQDNNDVIVYSYNVNEGDLFNDLLNKANSRDGYTALPGFYDEAGNPWDETFTHPGGEVDTSIKVYAKYIEGEYKLVSTKDELLKHKNKSIYLLNDIDLEGEEINFNDYKEKMFNGNGHKIYNFVIGCDPSNLTMDLFNDTGTFTNLYCGLFRQLEDSTIENVTFEQATLVVDTNYSKTTSICVSPFASSIKNSTIKNVNFSCDLTVTDKTTNFINNRNVDYQCIDNEFYSYKDDSSTIENSIISIT